MTDAEKIAEKVGVCRQTVSAVLNGSCRKFSAATRKAILAAAEEFGYTPDLNAKAMSGRSVRTIGLIMPTMMSALAPYTSYAVNAEVKRRGYKCYMISPSCADEEKAVVREFISRKFDGMIVGSLFRPFDFARCRIPTVVVGAREDSYEVSADLAYGMSLALDHLYRVHGRRNIVFLTGRPDGNTSKYLAYRHFMRATGLPERKPLEIQHSADVRRDAMELIHGVVDAFVSTSDILAGNFINMLNREGVKIPDEVAVTGYDGLLLSASGLLQLSSVVHPVRAIAARCVELLFAKIEGGISGRISEPERLKPAFFKGQTCGCQGIIRPISQEAANLDSLTGDPAFQSYFESEPLADILLPCK